MPYGASFNRHAYTTKTLFAGGQHNTSTINGTGIAIDAFNHMAIRLSVEENTTAVGSVIVQWSNDDTNWSKKGQLTADPTTTAHSATVIEATICGKYVRIQCTNFNSSYQMHVEAFCQT